MKIRELTGYSRKMIKGKRTELFLICLLPIGTELFLRTAEAALYSLMLYFGNIQSIELFTGKNMEQAVLSVLFSLLRCLIMPPLWCGLAARLMMFAEGKKESPSFSDMLLSGKFIVRTISASLFVRLISAILLLPCIAAISYAVYTLSDGAEGAEFFMAVNLIAVGIALGIYWAAVRLSFTAVPFLLWRYRNLSAAKVVFLCFRFMRQRRKLPFMLILTYLPPILTIAAAPYFIPEWAAAYAVSISIFLKEDESADERAYICGGYRKSTAAEKLSSGKLRRFGRIAEKAQE